MTIPAVVETTTQGSSQYDVSELTALVTAYSEEQASANVVVETPVVTQNSESGVITVTAKITIQSYLNGTKSQVAISQPPLTNTFTAPIPILEIDHVVGFSIYNVSHNFPVGTEGDFILTILGDNLPETVNIVNPFD